MNYPHPLPTAVNFTVDQYKQMIDAGVFAGRTDRIELIEGELRMMSPASDGHDDVIRYLDRWSHQNVGEQYSVAVQMGLRLLKSESMPEPDLYWIASSHGRGRPDSKAVPLVIEVSVSSLDADLTAKHHLYAQEGIPEYWVVDPETETIVVHRDPMGPRYGKIETFRIGQTVSTICLPGVTFDLKWLFHD